MTEKEKIKTSKFLSLILRHKPDVLPIELDENGWADCRELIKKMNNKGHHLKYNDLVQIVENNDKKRFLLSDDGFKIRANQGHSIEVDLQLETSIPPDILYHGTSSRYIDDIYASGGLQKMNRNHVHLSSDIETAIKVGKRHGGNLVMFVVNANQMYKDGHIFYCSHNGVWLTDNVPSEYLKFDNHIKNKEMDGRQMMTKIGISIK